MSDAFAFGNSEILTLFFSGCLDKSDQQRRRLRPVERFHSLVSSHRTTHGAHVHIPGKAHFALLVLRFARGQEKIAFVKTTIAGCIYKHLLKGAR